ncbi:XopAW family type III secretion system calcium-binding effector [Curvibacter sp. HBC28]|uniref:XopAW family type III secretion system calcium-binding effector n=1 Tax=Curvibacter microcysteis TaxID=3026419 RepID=A0ABT5MJB5_9BURK|nr:XopAW family type III secretion system calcium-binding effector [Curvibacter sp. HBC28]MDD0816669.1 XopAW family type III secretion system calcium-binding effector [Curvibacter sp. HBC28]
MSSLSSVSTSSHWTASTPPPRQGGAGRLAERLMSRFDSDSSDSVDSTELQSLLDDVAKKTGVSASSSASDLLASNDSDGDGNLSSQELAQTLQSILPPPSTMDFAQSRSSSSGSATGQAGDDLFSKVDSDGSGAVSQEELQGLLEHMSGNRDSTATSTEATALFQQLDSDSDGSLSSSEFDAGRPQNSADSGASNSTASANRPAPPPGGPGGPGRSGGASSSTSETYDPLDTNQDGVVSMEERLAANTDSTDPLQALFDTVDSNGDGSISSSETDSFVAQLNEQLNSLNTSDSSSSSSSSSSNSNSDTSTDSAAAPQDLLKLVQEARRAYQAHAQDWNVPVNSLSAMA